MPEEYKTKRVRIKANNVESRREAMRKEKACGESREVVSSYAFL